MRALHTHLCLAVYLPRKQQEATKAAVLSAATKKLNSNATTVPAATKRCMQQQHGAVASSSGLSTAIPAVEHTTVVDRLKLQLLQAYDNVSIV